MAKGKAKARKTISKVGGQYKVNWKSGRNLGGPYKTRKQASKRIQQVKYFQKLYNAKH